MLQCNLFLFGKIQKKSKFSDPPPAQSAKKCADSGAGKGGAVYLTHTKPGKPETKFLDHLGNTFRPLRKFKEPSNNKYRFDTNYVTHNFRSYTVKRRVMPVAWTSYSFMSTYSMARSQKISDKSTFGIYRLRNFWGSKMPQPATKSRGMVAATTGPSFNS